MIDSSGAHDQRIEKGPRLSGSRNVRLDRPQIECLIVAVGWAATVGLDGSWLWRVARVLLVALAAFVVARVSRSASPRRAATARVVFAIVTLPASATIAIAYATKTGMCIRAVAGLVATAGSISLLVGGLVALGRMSRGWRRWMIAPVGLVATFVAVSTIFPAVYATNVPRPRLGSQRPSDYGLAYLDATFATVDGFALTGWYIPSANRAAVVLLHGASSASSMLR